ncbi:Periplasmic beta-glucosidase [Sesamum angolense]|uniref:beta-glucosidase n=1 Tax=Sesamum angolense TaxID=2727404 RepID=A0AAE1WQ80_9LAMI|nr:Periplasmic beta-glucosidase [Sesamum angolense]
MSTFKSRFIMSVPVLELVLLLLLVASAAAEVIDTRYKDPKLPMNLRIKFLMEQMTLEEKIAQMAQINRLQAEADPKILRDYSIGSLITAPDSPPGGDHRASAEQWVDMVNGYQRWSLSHRLGIPMLYATDSVHGHNNLYRATIFPHNVGLGATRDPALVKRIGAVTAIETRASGIPYVFAPCIARSKMGRCYESYSEDHKIVEQMTDIIFGLQGEIPPNLPKGVPYIAGKKKVAACAKHFVGDGGTAKGMNENNTVIDWHGLLSIHMPGYYHSIIKGSQTFGKRGCKKITCALKEWKRCHETFNSIPKKDIQILVAGTHANNLGLQCGAWTITWQGQNGHNLTTGTTILNAISANVDPSTEIVYSENPDVKSLKSSKYSYAVVVVGEPTYAESAGDNLNLTIPEPGLSTLINVCSKVKCVVVLISGRPLVVEPYLPMMDALVAAWLPGSEGEGVADVLFGDYGFTGKLPRTWFRTVDQLPMNVGDKHYDPLFPFGFGLTTKPINGSMEIET